MSTRVWSHAFLFLVLTAGAAAAAPGLVILDYGAQLQRLKRDPHARPGLVADCRAAIADAQGAMQPGDTVPAHAGEFDGLAKARKGDGDDVVLASRDASSICDQLEALAPWSETAQALERAQNLIDWIRVQGDDISDTALSDEHVAEFVAAEQACRPAAAAMAKGPYRAFPVSSGFSNVVIDVATAAQTVCDALAARIVDFKKLKAEREAVNRAWWEETAAPYRKAGIAGERLDYFVSADGIAIYGKGGKELTTPKQKAAAKVTFEVLTGSDGGVTVKRLAWKGNKAAGWSQRDYPTRPGPSAFR